MAKRQQRYYRTAALLGAQPQVNRRARRSTQPVQLPWPWILLALVLLLAATWLWLDQSWYVADGAIQVIGASGQTAREVALASGLPGMHRFWVHPAESVDRILAQVPAITQAQVSCTLYPAGCTIQVNERQPVLVWVTESGTQWVDTQGALFPAWAERADLPQVRGPLPGSTVPLELLTGVRDLIRLGVPADALEYTTQRGLVWTDPQGRRVAFGVGGEMQARWQVYQALIADLDARQIFPAVIDVRFPAAPTYALDRLW